MAQFSGLTRALFNRDIRDPLHDHAKPEAAQEYSSMISPAGCLQVLDGEATIECASLAHNLPAA